MTRNLHENVEKVLKYGKSPTALHLCLLMLFSLALSFMVCFSLDSFRHYIDQERQLPNVEGDYLERAKRVRPGTCLVCERIVYEPSEKSCQHVFCLWCVKTRLAR